MVARVQKWGNSQGLRLAKHLLESARLAIGDEVEVSVRKGQILIKKAKRKFNLKEMVARLPADYQAHEESFGKPLGKETW